MNEATAMLIDNLTGRVKALEDKLKELEELVGKPVDLFPKFSKPVDIDSDSFRIPLYPGEIGRPPR